MQTVRIMIFDRLDNYLFDIDPTEVLDDTYVETINGENSLTISTSQELEKTNRLLIRDGMGVWHEYVVAGIEETHDGKEYYCIWSLQYDLSATFINGPYDCGIVPGHQSVPQLPHRAMEVSLGSTSRWTIGTITVTSMGAASFYRRSGWEGLQTVIEKWGGELRANITVDSHGIVARAVDLLAHLGTETATRRFDYGFDLKGIKRTVSDDVWPCRIVPLGKAQQTEGGGYTRRPSIASVNDNVMWLEDASAVEETRILSPSGDWEYPTSIVFNDTYEEPADLKAWALEHITEYTRPKVTYEAEVLQFARAGLNAHGVALGDDVVVVDRTFGHGKGLRISARVVKIQGSILDPTDTTLTIGNAKESFSGQLAGVSSKVDALSDTVTSTQTWQATATYLSNLITRLNGEINATGGYTYITEGEGLRTYDRPVSDPLVGAEATQVVEIKGGNIRIANSRTQAGDWDWKTVLQSGHILADLVTAAKLTAGYIGSAQSGNYWDLDSGQLRMASTTLVGNQTVQQIADASSAAVGQTASEQLASAVQSINEDIEDIYSQLDGAIDMWFYQVDPSMSLPPVTTDPSDPDNTGWDTTAKKDAHVGDLYYNTVNGHSWRFIKESGAYSWSLITDSDVTRALEMASQAQATADAKRRVFVSTPYPPYDVGDLWVQGAAGGILKCVTAKAEGYSYAASDWAAASKYTDDSALTSFLTNAYASDKATLEGLIDGKAETWYQSSDPSTGWTAAQKSSHQGDLWYKTTDQTTWRWSGTEWVAQNAPKEVFDAIDGKAQVFTSRPYPPYAIGDVWFEGTSGDIKVCVNGCTSGSYVTSDWEKRNKYTDDSALTAFMNGDYATDLAAITTQIDRKAETWYQEADPSRTPTTWDADEKAEHVGDLWYRTTDGTTWRWGGSSWVEQSTPTAVFDAIDGKAQIFTSTPAPPYNVGDLWFDSTASAIMVCIKQRTTGAFVASEWAKRDKYTDDTALNNLQLSATNLVRNGDFMSDISHWGKTSGVTLSVEEDESFVNALKCEGVGGSRRVWPVASNFNHVAGRRYSLSFWAKVANESEDEENPTTNVLYASRAASTTAANSYVRGATVTTEWQRYTGTITASATGTLNFWLGTIGTLYLANVMVVAGDKPMFDWSPDPRDAFANIDMRLTQQDIFNRLTNAGQAKGLYMEGTDLYVNATYLATGIITDVTGSNWWNLATGDMRMVGVADSLEVSATNLVRNGDFSNEAEYWVGGSGTTISSVTDSERTHCLKAVQGGAGGTADYRVYVNLTSSFRHRVGDTYSICFWAKASRSTKLWCAQGLSTSEALTYVHGESITTSWKRYTGTITATTDGGLNFWIEASGTLYLSDVMLVEGDMSMLTWSPDPRDALVELTQTEVFNRLTNNGALKGLYMENGQLYINATYLVAGLMSADRISGGTLTLGGPNNQYGHMTLLNDSGATALSMNWHGITTNDGNHRLTFSDSEGIRAYGNTRPIVKFYNPTNTSDTDNETIAYGKLSGRGGVYSGNKDRGEGYYSAILTSTSTITGNLKVLADLTITGRMTAGGTKSRVVRTPDYGDRLLYAYETPTPYFGDIGSATIGEDGLCVVGIDPIFAETARTDMAYQVFLQKCGEGDLWVDEKAPTHFVVRGTAGLAFDWEVKCHQRDYETERIEDLGIVEATTDTSKEGEVAFVNAYLDDEEWAMEQGVQELEGYQSADSYAQQMEQLLLTATS